MGDLPVARVDAVEEAGKRFVNFLRRFKDSFQLSIVISILALVTSAAALYLNDFRVIHDLQLVYTDVQPQPPTWKESDGGRECLDAKEAIGFVPYAVDLAVVNSGNRDAMLVTAYVCYQPVEDVGFSSSNCSDKSIVKEPLHLKPRELSSIRAVIQNPPDVRYFIFGRSHRANVDLQTTMVDSDGGAFGKVVRIASISGTHPCNEAQAWLNVTTSASAVHLFSEANPISGKAISLTYGER